MQYLAVLHQDRPDGPVGVTVPDLPGCFSTGDTAAAALDQAGEAIAAWIDSAHAHGDPVPAPSISIDPDGGRVGVVEVDPAPDRAARLNITLPARIVGPLDEAARREGTTRSGLLARLAAEHLSGGA